MLIGLRERAEEGWHAVRVYYLLALEVGGVFRQRRGTHEGGQARLQRVREAADMQRRGVAKDKASFTEGEWQHAAKEGGRGRCLQCMRWNQQTEVCSV